MCGIAGICIYGTSGQLVDHAELLRIRDSMFLRGPDGCGEWYSGDGRTGLAHRRLSIIDLTESGAQPMQNADGSLVISFNGEIYNYQELRAQLEKKGYVFRSRSDTEVLLHLYAEKGVDMLRELRGMFAFAIRDERKQGVLIARDPFGIKPLYYSDNGEAVRFASQVKALLAGGGVDTSPEPAGHVGFFLWGHVPEPYTLYKGIRSLPAGSYAWLQQSPSQHSLAVHQYCSIPEELLVAGQNPVSLSGKDLLEYVRATLLDSVTHHLLADVPVGVFLSSGLDSTVLAALSSETVRDRLHTVTLGFREYEGTANDEVPLAELVAQRYGAFHSTNRIDKAAFRNELPRLLDAMDQPSIDGINSYFVSKAAAQAGLKVAISGLGGDELFGSYPSFRQIPRLVNSVGAAASVPGLGRGFRLVSAPFIKRFTSPKYAGILEYGGDFEGAYLLRRGMYMPWELPDLIDPEMVREGWKELQTLPRLKETSGALDGAHQKVSSLELCWYMRNQLLRDTDWASMAHSLEVRVPLVDLDVLRKLAPVIAGSRTMSKRDMAAAPRIALPDEVVSRPKTGFSVPTRTWMQETLPKAESSLRGWAQQVHSHLSRTARFPVRYRQPTIVVFRFGQLGDTLVSMPALHLIRKRFPLHRMLLLTDSHAGKRGYVSSWDVLEPTGWFDDVIYYEPSRSLAESGKNMFTLYRKLSSLRPHHIFNLSPDRTERQAARDRLFFRRIVGEANYHSLSVVSFPERLPNGKLPLVAPEWKSLLTTVSSVSESEDHNSDFQFELPLSENSLSEARLLLASCHLNEATRIVAIGPGSKMPSKCWPRDNYSLLGKELLNRFQDIHLVVLGGKEDVETGAGLCCEWGGRSSNLAGRLSIHGSAAVLKRCVCYAGNDTGTMHLAGLAGTPCAAVFSARDYPGKWEPYGTGHKILRAAVSCEGCMLEVCPRDNECLRRLPVSLVCETVEGLIQ